MAVNCKLEKGDHVLTISTNYKTIDISHCCLSDAQAEQMAKRMVAAHMRSGWELVMLNGKRVKQGKLVLPNERTISKIEKAPSYLPQGDGTVGRQE